MAEKGVPALGELLLEPGVDLRDMRLALQVVARLAEDIAGCTEMRAQVENVYRTLL